MKDDKFIMMGLDDERSKDIAEVLGNKTCKKIIEHLAETKEASEKDISDALGIPINTVEYNLNKLIKTGLVEKAKNFFWSVKGKKIDMYRLAKKHIVISPKPKRVDMKELRTILPLVLIAAAIIAIVALLIFPFNEIKNSYDSNETQLKQFSSYTELKEFLNSTSSSAASRQNGLYAESLDVTTSGVTKASAAPSAAGAGDSASSYSRTNIQVEGVDEADIVKNDGKYIYTLSGNKAVIVLAYPAEQMKKLSEIKINNAQNMFINGDRLIVFANDYSYIAYSETRCLGIRCRGSSAQKASVYIYDIKDREKPVLERNLSFEGNYVDARMIGEYVYLISSKYAYNENFAKSQNSQESPLKIHSNNDKKMNYSKSSNDYPVPMYEVNGIAKEVSIADVYYSPYVDNNYVFTSINAINLDNDELKSKVYLTGSTGEVYVSENNIYLTYQKSVNWEDYNDRRIKEVYLAIAPEELKEKIQEVIDSNAGYEKQNKINNLIYSYSMSLSGKDKEEFDSKLQKSLDDFEKKIEKERDKTIVHKINIDKDKIEYKSGGEVPGHVLNQFSMDEYKGNLRVATTTGEVWSGSSLNHVYVLDKELKIIGKLEDLAHGEKIYSARFIGKRAYVVTFKKVDPLFVIDLSDAEAPKVLGYLKIPGYSDYLHPYDEAHIIGIGKEAADASSEEANSRNLDFAWYQGVKISLFDVSDVENPKEKGKLVIGDRGTDSPALTEHKALLFDKEKGILVLPIRLAEIDRSKYSGEIPANAYGEVVWQGIYVLNLDLNGITERGRISHVENYSLMKYGAAKDEDVGAVRKDKYENAWEKISLGNYGYGEWKTNATGYSGAIYNDYNIDSFPGGINYMPYYDYSTEIQRSLYMENVLYSVSPSKIKANDINTIEELNRVELGYNEGQVVYGEKLA